MGSTGIEGRQGLGKGWVSLKMKTYFGISVCQGLGGKKSVNLLHIQMSLSQMDTSRSVKVSWFQD